LQRLPGRLNVSANHKLAQGERTKSMPMVTADDGCAIYVEVTGKAGAPALMLSNSLGTNLHMWDDQATEFARHFRLVRYDRRGHGNSGVPNGPYSMERLGRDVTAVLDSLGIEKTNWCGLSMGGMVGQWLGAHAPTRIDKLILSNTSAYYADKSGWNDRIRFLAAHGLEKLAPTMMGRWFTPEFVAAAPQTIARMTQMFLATKLPGYIGCCEAIRDMDFRDSNARIAAPTLVIVGARDPATPPAAGEAIQKSIPGARLASIEAAHIANVERPQDYTKTVLNFLQP
jgi:3-oxoadipate enol-lactonase